MISIPTLPFPPEKLNEVMREFAHAVMAGKFELSETAEQIHSVFTKYREWEWRQSAQMLRATHHLTSELTSDEQERLKTLLSFAEKPMPPDKNGDGMCQTVLSFLTETMKFGGHVPHAVQHEAVATTGLIQWHTTGCPTFRLEDSLTAALLMTEVDNTAPLNLPFPSFLIQFPRDFLKVMPNSRDGVKRVGDPVPANRILISQVDQLGLDIGQTVVQENVRIGEIAGRMAKKSARAHNLIVRLVSATEPLKHDAYRVGPFQSSETALEDLSGEWNTGSNNELDGVDTDNLTKAWRLALNVVQYINSVHSSTLPKHKSEGHPNITLERVAPKRWLLGNSVKLPQNLVVAAKAHGTNAPGWRLKHQFVVRGHWRNQAVGIGRSERKTIWIEPFWKGPKATETGLLRAFKVEEHT